MLTYQFRCSQAYCLHIWVFAAFLLGAFSTYGSWSNKYVPCPSQPLDSLFLEDTTKPFFSLPACSNAFRGKPYLSFEQAGSELNLANKVILGFQTSEAGSIGHAIAAGRLRYRSDILDAHVHLQANTIAEMDTSTYIHEVSLERAISGMPHIRNFSSYDFLLRESYFTLKWNDCRLDVGKKRMRWGPGYKGTLGWSGVTHAPYSLYQLYIPMGDGFRYSSFFHGYDDINTSNIPRFGGGQRVDIRICDYVDLGMYELVVFHGMQDFAQYFVPLQLYYLGSNAGDNAPENLLGGADLNIYLKPVRLYAEFINDDITVFDNRGNPNKYAFQIGSAWHSMGPLRVLGVEYTHVSPYIYGHRDSMNRHVYQEESLGWPWGNDQDVFNLHAAFDFCAAIRARSEITYWLLGKGRTADSWTADGRPNMDSAPYWPQNADHLLSLLVSLHYSPAEWIHSSLYLRPAWLNKAPTHSLHLFLQFSVPAGIWGD